MHCVHCSVLCGFSGALCTLQCVVWFQRCALYITVCCVVLSGALCTLQCVVWFWVVRCVHCSVLCGFSGALRFVTAGLHGVLLHWNPGTAVGYSRPYCLAQATHSRGPWGKTLSPCFSCNLSVSAVGVTPILNWANVCSLNILRTVRRTMILFLIELLVRRIWFRQSKVYFVLNWLVMRCKLRPELAADAQQTAWSKM